MAKRKQCHIKLKMRGVLLFDMSFEMIRKRLSEQGHHGHGVLTILDENFNTSEVDIRVVEE